MKEEKGGVKKDKSYQLVCDDKFTRMSLAIVQADYEYFAQVARSTKISRKQFILLCQTAINTKRTSILKAVLDSYHTFWDQSTFEALTSYVMAEKRYDFLPFLDAYIDKVNAYNKSIEEWNAYIADKNEKEAIQAEKDKKWYRKLYKKLKGVLSKISIKKKKH